MFIKRVQFTLECDDVRFSLINLTQIYIIYNYKTIVNPPPKSYL